jgi:glycosyltransferase involved in cell wall biosynthesis
MRDPRITYIKKKNGGVSGARNAGIAAATSGYIAFLDADDIWMPEKLEKQLRVMMSDANVGLVYGHHYIIDEDGVIQGNLRHTIKGAVFDKLVSGNFISGSASMVLLRRDILDKSGYFREDFVNGEDWDLWLRISKLCLIDYVPEILASIRTHPAGAQQNAKKMTDGLVYAYHCMKKNLDLTETQKRLLASYCLFNSAISYYHLNEMSLARRTMWELLKENPPVRSDREHWRIGISYGIFLKMIATIPTVKYLLTPMRSLKNVLYISFRSVRIVLRLFWRVVCRASLYISEKAR